MTGALGTHARTMQATMKHMPDGPEEVPLHSGCNDNKIPLAPCTSASALSGGSPCNLETPARTAREV